TMAIQRAGPTRSASIGAEKAAIRVGLANMIVMTVASGSRLNALTRSAAPTTNSAPRVSCPDHETIRKAGQPPTSITYGTMNSNVAACRRQITCPTGNDSVKNLETASFPVSNAIPPTAVTAPLSAGDTKAPSPERPRNYADRGATGGSSSIPGYHG